MGVKAWRRMMRMCVRLLKSPYCQRVRWLLGYKDRSICMASITQSWRSQALLVCFFDLLHLKKLSLFLQSTHTLSPSACSRVLHLPWLRSLCGSQHDPIRHDRPVLRAECQHVAVVRQDHRGTGRCCVAQQHGEGARRSVAEGDVDLQGSQCHGGVSQRVSLVASICLPVLDLPRRRVGR